MTFDIKYAIKCRCGELKRNYFLFEYSHSTFSLYFDQRMRQSSYYHKVLLSCMRHVVLHLPRRLICTLRALLSCRYDGVRKAKQRVHRVMASMKTKGRLMISISLEGYYNDNLLTTYLL